MAPSRNERRKEGSMRIDAALAAMRPKGFPDRVVRKSVKDLLKIYGVGDNGWYFIEEASYKLLIETILENEEQLQPEKNASEVEKQGDQRVHNVDGNGEHQRGSLPLLCDHQDSNHGPQEASLVGKHCCAESPRFLLPVDHRFHGKITFNHMPNIAVFLRENLSEEALAKLRATVFGHILDVGVVAGQAQVVHGLCLREVECLEAETMQFYIGGRTIRFGLKEFGLVSGLRIHGDLKMPVFEDKDHRLMRCYFKDAVSVDKASLIDCIKFQRWDNVDDSVKLAILLVIHCFVLSSRRENQLTRDDFALVDTGKFAEYPWGLASFKLLSASLKDRLSKRQGDRGVAKSFHYKVDGCPPVFQCWFYECCPRMCGTYASRLRTGRPRMCNWSSQGPVKMQMEAINKNIFDSHGLSISNIVPTVEELALVSGVGLSQRVDEVGVDDERGHFGLNSPLEDRLASLESAHGVLRNDVDELKAVVRKGLAVMRKGLEVVNTQINDLRRELRACVQRDSHSIVVVKDTTPIPEGCGDEAMGEDVDEPRGEGRGDLPNVGFVTQCEVSDTWFEHVAKISKEQPHEGQEESWKDIVLDEASSQKEEADAAIANDADERCRSSIHHQSTSTPTLQLPTTPVGIRPVTPLLLSPSPRVISSAPPPPPLPTTAGCGRPSKRRQPCYGWIDSDEDDTNDDFIELTPAAEWDDSSPGQAHRRSRWDLRPEDP